MTAPGREFVGAIQSLMRVLEAGTPGMIIGGIAVVALGYARATADVDATVLTSLDDIPSLTGRLQDVGIEPRIQGAIDFAKSSRVLLMRHRDSGVEIDISLAALPFEEEAIANRRFVDLGGVRMAIPRVEDLLVYKMVAFRPQDLRDVEELLLRYFKQADLARVRSLVSEFSGVLERPEMIARFDELVTLARSPKK